MATFPTDQPSNSVFPSSRFNQVLRWFEQNNNIPSGVLSGRPVLSASSHEDERRPGRPYLVTEDDSGADTITVNQLHIWNGTRWIQQGSDYTFVLEPRGIITNSASQETGSNPNYWRVRFERNDTNLDNFVWQFYAPENAPQFGTITITMFWFIEDPNDLGGMRYVAEWLQVPQAVGYTADLSANWTEVGAETIEIEAGDNNRALRKTVFTVADTADLPEEDQLFFVRIRRDGTHDEDTANDESFLRYGVFSVSP